MTVRTRDALPTLALALAACSSGDRDRDALVAIVAPEADDPLRARMIADLEGYLETIAGEPAALVRTDAAHVDDAIDREGRELAIVLDAQELGVIDDARIAELGPSGFLLDVEGDERAVAWLGGATPLARQFAMYELLRRLGARFHHPEEEFVPSLPAAQLAARARTPTILQRGRSGDPLPDFAWRSWSFHSQHPLEHLEAFSDGDFPIDEAERVEAWIVKSFGNRFRGAGRGVATASSAARRVDELEQLRVELGFPRGGGIALHNQQQGASAQIDPTSATPVQAQIEQLVAQQLDAQPDAAWFGIHFGPTEFTTTPDVETVQWIDWTIAAVLERAPQVEIEINNHITGSQPSPNFDDLGCPNGTNDGARLDYYDLAFATDPRAGVSVHTVMFYPLEGPARVYEQQSFAHKLCLMQRASAAGRPLTWFPEGAWWLAFDNAVPLYMPLYLVTRARDVELLRPLLPRNGGTLRGHRMFNTGHEWGYWQQDYAVGLLAWNADLGVAEILGDMFDPLCPPEAWPDGCAARDEAIALVTELAAHQRDMFLARSDGRGRPGGLYTYFAGEDPADAIAAEAGLEFRPVRPGFADIARLDADGIADFRASDLAALQESLEVHRGLQARGDALWASDLPEPAAYVFAEVRDGITIDRLRVEQAVHLYAAVLAFREAQLAEDPDPAAAAQPDLDLAAAALAQATQVIARREQSYRYPAAQSYGGGITPETAVPNGTTYGFRVYTKTHLATYWHGRDDEARRVITGEDAGAPNRVEMRGGIAAIGEDLALVWPALPGLAGTVSVGALGEVGPPTTTFDMRDVETFAVVAGQLESPDGSIPVAGAVARSDVLARSPAQGITLIEPGNETAQGVLRSVFPAFAWGRVDVASTLAFAPDVEDDGSTLAVDVGGASYTVDGETFVCSATDFVLPIALGSGSAVIDVGVRDAVFRGSLALPSPLHVSGNLVVEDLVDSLVELAGFDRKGALETVGTVFEFDADAPPQTVPFVAEIELRPW